MYLILHLGSSFGLQTHSSVRVLQSVSLSTVRQTAPDYGLLQTYHPLAHSEKIYILKFCLHL